MDSSSVLRPYSCYLIVECQSLLVSDLTNVSPICIAQWCADVEPEVGATFVETMRLVQLAGGEAVPVTLPELEHLRVAHLMTIASESRQAMKPYTKVCALAQGLNHGYQRWPVMCTRRSGDQRAHRCSRLSLCSIAC